MKVIRLNGLKPELVDLDYNVIKAEMEKWQKNEKTEKADTYSKLLQNLEENSSAEVIENEVNKIIDSNREKVNELKKEIKRLEKETSLLAQISRREVDSDVIFTTVANL